jgi:hypothetical protein
MQSIKMKFPDPGEYAVLGVTLPFMCCVGSVTLDKPISRPDESYRVCVFV